MGIIFTCPHCGAETDVEPKFIGQSGPCFACGKVVVVTPPATAAAAGGGWSPEDAFRETGKRNWQGLFKLTGLACLLALLAFGAYATFFWGVLPMLGMDIESARQKEIGDKLVRIAKALEAYHADHGRLPPPYTVDANGKPMHSWRALLIPYLDDAGVMGGYNFSEPWDSVHNSDLHPLAFEPFQLPEGAISAGLNHTGFMVIVGADTLFPSNGVGTALSQASDGLSETLLVVEVAQSGVHWLEPVDLNRSLMSYVINGDPATEISDENRKGAWVVMADGEVRFLAARSSTPDQVESLVTAAAGDNL